MITIRTAVVENASGQTNVVAKGDGKQRTIPFVKGKSEDRNHGTAAATLAMALHLDWHDGVKHMVEADGRHRFVF